MSQKLLQRPVIAFVLCAPLVVPVLAGDKVSVQSAMAEPIKLSVGKQVLLRSEMKVLRTAVADPEICRVNQYSASELGIVARTPGKTDVTIWFSEPDKAPLTYVVEVQGDKSASASADCRCKVALMPFSSTVVRFRA
jgi:Flp pilus assembly secretin CpaC